MFVPISSTNTSRPALSLSATIILQAALSHSSRSMAPQSFFSAEAHPFEEPPEGGFAEAPATEALQEVTPIRDGSCWPSTYVLFEELPCSLVGFGRPSTSLSGGERLSLAGESGVALDG